MKLNKLLLPLLMSIPVAHAAIDFFRPLEVVADGVFELGSFVWVTDKISATKFAIFITLLALLFYLLQKIPVGGGHFDKRISGVIAVALSSIGVLFLPNNLVGEIGAIYSGTFALIILMVPVALILTLGILVTRENEGVGEVHWNSAIARHGIRFITAVIALTMIAGVLEEYKGVIIGLVISTKFMKKWLSS